MKKYFIALLIAVLPAAGFAAGAGPKLDKANIDLRDTASLQRGARLFVNYCLGCHSASFMRYSRIGRDLELSDEVLKSNLMFTTDKVGDVMETAMRAQDAKNWFGVAPPDLSVIARARGVDWLYTYLRGFYVDESRPFGVNNTVFPDVGMPHVLGELQGWQKPVYAEGQGEGATKVVERLELAKPGTMTPAEYDNAVRDLVNFLAYMGEPAKLERQRIGIWVMVFLAVFFVVAYLLKKEYWKDVH